MCVVIVVDQESFPSTNLGRVAYIHDPCLGYHHNYFKFYQLPNSNLFTRRVLFFLREATSEIYGPPSLFFIIFALEIYFYSLLFSDQLHFYLFILSRVPARSIYPIYYNFIYLFTREALTTPLLHWVASICSLCAGAFLHCVAWCS